jgi:hypothetical protein
VIFAVLLIPVAIFLRGDADLGLLFLSSPPEMSYLNQVIWITGASSGIGAATALEFSKLGAKVIISARRTDKLYALSNVSEGQGGHEMFVVPLDLMDFESHEKAYKTILEKFGHIDLLVLNAGQSQRNSALETPFEDTRSLMELNFFSCVHLAKLVVPGMVTNGGGKVVSLLTPLYLIYFLACLNELIVWKIRDSNWFLLFCFQIRPGVHPTSPLISSSFIARLL